MKKFRVYRPNMSDYKLVEGTHMTISVEGKTNIWNHDVLVASIPNNISVIVEQ